MKQPSSDRKRTTHTQYRSLRGIASCYFGNYRASHLPHDVQVSSAAVAGWRSPRLSWRGLRRRRPAGRRAVGLEGRPAPWPRAGYGSGWTTDTPESLCSSHLGSPGAGSWLILRWLATSLCGNKFAEHWTFSITNVGRYSPISSLDYGASYRTIFGIKKIPEECRRFF